jgi:hypothetical protein
VVSQLTGTTAEASRNAGAGALVRAELSSASPVFLGADHQTTSIDDVVPGVIHLAVPFDDNWSLTVDGESIAPRRAFGLTTAFDVETAGTGELTYTMPSSRGPLVEDEILIDLGDADIDADAASSVSLDPGLDLTARNDVSTAPLPEDSDTGDLLTAVLDAALDPIVLDESDTEESS